VIAVLITAAHQHRRRLSPASPAKAATRAATASGNHAGAARIAFFLVLSFPATLLLLVWAFSAVLDDHSVRKSVVDAIVR